MTAGRPDPDQYARAKEILNNTPELRTALIMAWYHASQLTFTDKLALRPYLAWVYNWENLPDEIF